MGHRGISYASYKGCAEKALFLYRHPERSRGIFLVHRYSVVCVIAEKGKTFAKGARKSRVQGGFLAALEMTVWGNGFISRSVQRICLENAIHATSSRAKPSIFFVGGKTASVWQQGMGNTVWKERWDGASRKRHSEGVMEKRDEKDFSLLEMRGDIPWKALKYETAHHSYLQLL